jgi:hypothetical protein
VQSVAQRTCYVELPIGQTRFSPLVPVENFRVDGLADLLSLMGAFAAVSLLELRLQSQRLFRSFQVRIHFEEQYLTKLQVEVCFATLTSR